MSDRRGISQEQKKRAILAIVAFCAALALAGWIATRSAGNDDEKSPPGDIYYTGFMPSKPERQRKKSPAEAKEIEERFRRTGHLYSLNDPVPNQAPMQPPGN